MEEKLIALLLDAPQYEWVKLNEFWKANFGEAGCDNFRTLLVDLMKDGDIEIKDGAFRNMCGMVRVEQNDRMNVQATPDNWPIFAKLTRNGRKKNERSVIPESHKIPQHLVDAVMSNLNEKGNVKPKWRTAEFWIEDTFKKIYGYLIAGAFALFLFLYNTCKDKKLYPKSNQLPQKQQPDSVSNSKRKDTAPL